MELFFGVLFISFMFIGIVFTVYAVIYLLLQPKADGETVLVPLYETDADIEKRLGFITYRHMFCSDRVKIVIVDMGLNNIQRELCERFVGEYPSVLLVSPEKITEVL